MGKSEASVPDVTVIVAVFNTMPYLRSCLASLLGQTIGHDRLEVIAVDDGSTDGSGAELDRWQAKHPAVIRVIHQENSGGPAGPSNRALERATGRYVFFVGADDRLGAEALARLVEAADRLEADIVLGRLVGDGGRVVNQSIYDPGDRDDVTLVNSALPMALSNTKLYRRALLSEHQIRYREQLRSGSDQPFTLEALRHARRVAVRADYKFYYAVRRTDSSNITYNTALHGFVHDTAVLMDLAADLVDDPVAHARVIHRHFSWEVAKLVGDRLLLADRAEQGRVQEGVRKLAETYLTDEIRSRIEVHKRVLISVAQFGTLDDLLAAARHHAAHPLEPVLVEGDKHYLAYPGFRDARLGFPDDWFDGTDRFAPPRHQAAPATVHWGRDPAGRRALLVGWHSTLPDLLRPDEPRPRPFAGDCLATRSEIDPTGEVRAEFALDDLLIDDPARHSRKVRLARTVGGEFHNLPVTWSGAGRLSRILHRRGPRFWVVYADAGPDGQLRIVVTPVTPRRMAGAVLRRLRLR